MGIWTHPNTFKSGFNEYRFNEISQFSEQMPAPLNYFTIVNLIPFSELHDLVNKSGLTSSFVKSRLECTTMKVCACTKVLTTLLNGNILTAHNREEESSLVCFSIRRPKTRKG